jgi:hypothetical protein
MDGRYAFRALVPSIGHDLIEDAAGRFLRATQKRDRGPQEGRSQAPGGPAKSPDGRPFPRPRAGAAQSSAPPGHFSSQDGPAGVEGMNNTIVSMYKNGAQCKDIANKT